MTRHVTSPWPATYKLHVLVFVIRYQTSAVSCEISSVVVHSGSDSVIEFPFCRRIKILKQHESAMIWTHVRHHWSFVRGTSRLPLDSH